MLFFSSCKLIYYMDTDDTSSSLHSVCSVYQGDIKIQERNTSRFSKCFVKSTMKTMDKGSLRSFSAS